MLFATPGMLQGGLSLEVFKAWAPDRRNLVVLPSYQVRSLWLHVVSALPGACIRCIQPKACVVLCVWCRHARLTTGGGHCWLQAVTGPDQGAAH